MHIKTTDLKLLQGSSDKSILDTAISQGLKFEYSCKTGQCGMCETLLLDGDVVELKPQLALSEEDKALKKILSCCCAPKTDILIDAVDLTALHGQEIQTLPARIKSITKHTLEIIEISLRLPPSVNFLFLEGQYLDVIYRDIKRSYSIASTVNQKEITLLIKKFANGKMSDYWFNHAKENDLLRIEGPKGTFFIRDKEQPLLFLATGTGIAPVISILTSLENDQNYIQKQPIYVYWGNRNPEEFVWQPKFKKLELDFNQVCSKEHNGWNGKVGYVQNEVLIDIFDINKYSVYACGSNSMIKSAKQELVKSGLPGNQFYSDAFVQSF